MSVTTYRPPSPAPELTPKAVAKRIGREYVESDSLPCEDNRATERAYRSIAKTVTRLFDRIPVPVVYQSDDPYDSYADMARTVGREQMLRVYCEHAGHPFLSDSENLKFRAVHDWFGHLEADVHFKADGEFKKWQHMKQYFSGPNVHRVMFAEVVGQVGAAYYLRDGFGDDRFTQRAFIAPKWWIHWMRAAVDG